MNQINIRQNEPESLDKLAAKKQIYSDAKVQLGFYLILSIPVMVLLNSLVKPILFKDILNLGFKLDLTNAIAIFALLLTICELAYLKPVISKLKEKAAKIQEEFDCYIFDLEWNEILCGSKPSGAEVQKYSDKCMEKGIARDKFLNWYTASVDQVDNVHGVLLCQNENLGWDVGQREKYVTLVNWVLGVFLFVSVCIAMYLDATLTSLILNAIIPCLPFVSYAITNLNENRDAIYKIRALKTATEKVGAIKNPAIKHVRNIQNLIFLNRANNSLIFDWYYDLYRASNQKGISYATMQLIKRLIK